ncbi:MAG: hypothetical protein CSA66_05535 [Proteobacteria bacterium]|nr:MAG: hypothetical protein CSA66_05535 [Pseudomonadota bacterium]
MRSQGQRNLFAARTAVATPDHPAAVSRSVAARLAFVRRVYGWMFAGVVTTVLGVAISIEAGIAETLLRAGILGNILLVVAWIGGAYGVQRVRHEPTWNVVAFAGYALFTGVVISDLVFVAMVLAAGGALGADGAYILDGRYVMQAGVLTLIAFGALSGYAFFSKRDLSLLRGMLVIGTVVMLVALVAGFFIESTVFHIVVSAFVVLLFAGYTLYDTQKVLRTYPDGEHVAGAMTLFLDFVMLFIYVLRIIMLIAAGGRE